MLHLDGENFFLTALFNGGTLPANYYLGLDNRATISSTDTMASLLNEPVGNGYTRQLVSSSSGFAISFSSGIWKATSSIVTFSASGSGWGPVTNIFLTNKSDNTGYLISSAALSGPTTLASGDSVQMRIVTALSDCTGC